MRNLSEINDQQNDTSVQRRYTTKGESRKHYEYEEERSSYKNALLTIWHPNHKNLYFNLSIHQDGFEQKKVKNWPICQKISMPL